METILACPICESKSIQHFLDVPDHSVSKENFKLQECGDCGFVFTSPRPEQKSIGAYYQSEEYISHTNTSASLRDKLYQIARNKAIKSKTALIRKHQKNGAILDYGCGTGEFLAYMTTRGFQAEGVEPDLKAREQAVMNHSLNVFPDHQKVKTQERFRVITMWHVLEHIHDLKQMMKWFYSALHPDGTMFIAVPNRESWDAQYYKSDWAAYDVPRHLSHFREQDVVTLANRHGFDHLGTKDMKMDAYYIAMLSEQYRGAGMIGSLIKGVIKGLQSNLNASSAGRGTSSKLYIFKKSKI